MARFSTAAVQDILQADIKREQLRKEYWQLIHSSAWYIGGGRRDEPADIGYQTPVNTLFSLGQQYCAQHGIRLHLDCREHCNDRWFGLAYKSLNRICIAPLRPENPRFKYQRNWPNSNRQAKTIWHEIAHIEHGHMREPKRHRELDAEATAYLVLLHLGRTYHIASADYIRQYFRVADRMVEMAKKREDAILTVTQRILG